MEEELFEGQQRFYNCDSNKKVFLGGRRSGKTHTLTVCAVEEAVENSSDVLFITNKHSLMRMAMDEVDEIVSFECDDDPANIIQRQVNKRKFESGGKIVSQTIQKMPDIRVNDYDMVIIDEVNDTPLDDLEKLYSYTYDMSLNLFDGEFYVSATPRVPKLSDQLKFLKNRNFEIVPVSSFDNPLVDQERLDLRREEMDEEYFKLRFMEGVQIGSHEIFRIKNETERIYKCMACDFNEELSLDREPSLLRLAEGYIFGKALDTCCS